MILRIPQLCPAKALARSTSPTDVTPEQFFQAIGRLRREARDEIERLLAFLDETEPDPDLEGDPAEAGIADYDGLLDQLGTRDWQQGGMA